MINVTQTYLPSLVEYERYLKKIWKTKWVTNNGPFLLELENKLKKHLGVKHLYVVNNGTIALQIAIKALELQGNVITTPFSYVATTSSNIWEGLRVKFADIEKDYLTINPAEIEKQIDKETSAIVATHVYGNPCNVEAIEKIAKRKKIRVIYDAAHAFGVKYKGKPLLRYGDISTLSFHATKIFHTIEGGAIITENDDIAHKVSYLRNFGHNGPEKFFGLGINGKCSEFHAAMGLCVLKDIKHVINSRKEIFQYYARYLSQKISKLALRDGTYYNYSYYPIFLQTENQLKKIITSLNHEGINPRRYFYPSLSTLSYVSRQPCPVAENISPRVLCLPLYVGLKKNDVKNISNIINNVIYE